MRRKLLLGNWKMNKTSAEAKQFALETKELVELASKNNIDIGVAPTYLSLAAVKENADTSCSPRWWRNTKACSPS